MRLYLKLAWRNIFRNTRRTVIAGIAIGIGLAAMIFVDALVIGMKNSMIHSATASFLGEGQVHREGFRNTLEVERTIVHADTTLQRIRNDSIVAHATPRTMSYAMLSSPSNLSAVSMVGVEPKTESFLSQVDDAIVEGAFFEGDSPRNLVIGRELAEILEVGLGDRVVMTTAQAETGDLAQELFRVSGIFALNIESMDKGMAFVRIDKAREMLNLPGGVHEIAIQFTDPAYGSNEDLPFWARYTRDGNVAIGWTTLLPQLDAALQISDFSTYLIGIILFGVVALGIVNTLFMSLYERMFEFGVMRAVGTSPFSMGRLVMFEAAALALLSIGFGIVLGFVVTLIVGHTGIDYTGIEFAGATFREPLYPVMKLDQYVRLPIFVFILTTLVGLYPAWYAARLKPAEAMRRSL